MLKYPCYFYCNLTKCGREMIHEAVSARHKRCYFAGRSGHLRLVLIQDDATNERLVLDEGALGRAFGVTLADLFPTGCPDYTRLQNLDAFCTWPERLYPDGPPAGAVATGKAWPARLPSVLGNHVAIFRADAWI